MKKSFLSFLALLMLFIGDVYSENWVEVPSGTSFILYGMSFPPGQNNIGYVAGMQYTYDAPGVIVKTTDSGETWSQILPVSGEIDGLQAICFISETTGFAGGWNDYFIKTTNGGTSWTDVTVGTDIWYFTNIQFWDESNGVVSAKMNDGGGKIYVTEDGGDTWSNATGVTVEVLGLDYADENTLFAVGIDGKIMKSANGGMSWSSVYQATGITFGVSFANTNFGVVGGEDGLIYTTNDGGSTWSDFSTGYHNFWAAFAFEGDSALIGGTDEDIYKTVDGGDTWAIEYNGSGSSSLYKIEFTENKTGLACGSQGLILRIDPPLGADFDADQTEVCAGGSVTFTDLSTAATSWSWIFEGGNPAFSTDQNPSVTYASTGTYNVTLTVSDGVGYSTLLKEEYISVLTTPLQANTPAGDVELCTSVTYEFSTEPIDFAESYVWAVAPPAAGIFVGDGNEVLFEASDSWTGNFTIKVKAVNICGDGEWSEDLGCQLFLSPSQFEVTGGGEICEGDAGMEIGLTDSEIGVDYELLNFYVPTGIIVAGTGEPIIFGLFTEEGNYSANGFNASCTITMIGEVSLIVNTYPVQLTIPEGTTQVCNTDENEYTTTGGQESDVIIWTLTPETAGTVSGNGMTTTVVWNNDYEGEAFLSVQAENACGLGLISDELEILVFGMPTPELAGLDFVCINEESIYSTAENEGNNYEWEVIGGTIVSGDGTAQISVLWGNDAGDGFVIVSESNAAGCSGIDAFGVTIDDCTVIREDGADNPLGIYPNPTQSVINIDLTNVKSEKVIISIYNSTGAKVLEFVETDLVSKQSWSINIDRLQQGIYIVTLQTDDNKIWLGKFDKISSK